MIEPEPDLMVCGEVQTEREARAAIRALSPDVVIVDISLAQGDGLELVRDVHAQRPDLPMLVLSMHDELIYAERLLAAGASGYIMKHAASDQLLIALRQVLSGDVYLSESLASNLGRVGAEGSLQRPRGGDPIERLSNRELQVLSLIGRGQSSREAAESLGLSVKTVETHRQSLKRKLNLATNAQLLQYAINWYASGRNRPSAEPEGRRPQPRLDPSRMRGADRRLLRERRLRARADAVTRSLDRRAQWIRKHVLPDLVDLVLRFVNAAEIQQRHRQPVAGRRIGAVDAQRSDGSHAPQPSCRPPAAVRRPCPIHARGSSGQRLSAASNDEQRILRACVVLELDRRLKVALRAHGSRKLAGTQHDHRPAVGVAPGTHEILCSQ